MDNHKEVKTMAPWDISDHVYIGDDVYTMRMSWWAMVEIGRKLRLMDRRKRVKLVLMSTKIGRGKHLASQ